METRRRPPSTTVGEGGSRPMSLDRKTASTISGRRQYKSTSSSNEGAYQSTARRRRRDRLAELCKKIVQHLIRGENGSSLVTEPYQSLNSKPSPLQLQRGSYGAAATRKRALLIGVTYKSWRHRLKGTINDVRNMRLLLIHQFGFPAENILVLTEEEEAELSPTKLNIKRSLEWLVKGCRSGDSLVFYFSGHGVRQPDFDHDEQDGFDETICPADFLEAGLISDNDINEAIVWPLKEGVTLHAIVDSCHSGTILDLTFLYNSDRRKWEDNHPPSGVRKHTEGGLAICISACEDSELAVDTSAFGKGMSGAMTYILVELVKQFPSPTYGDLMELIHEALAEVNNSGCFLSRAFRSMFHNKILQKPLLSASQPFDVGTKHFIL